MISDVSAAFRRPTPASRTRWTDSPASAGECTVNYGQSGSAVEAVPGTGSYSGEGASVGPTADGAEGT